MGTKIDIKKILNSTSLCGKSIAMTGCTGGLGKELCLYFARLGAELIMLDRNEKKATALEAELVGKYPQTKITRLAVDLEDMASVKDATERLLELEPDFFVHNAGAYHIPRHFCTTGYDNVFQINFVSPYYIIRTLAKHMPQTRFIAVGSIAHNYSKADFADIDFRTRTKSSKVYGNAKRYLMFSLYGLFEGESQRLSIAHPGITFTNITAHYPKLIFAIIKHPMKVIFMKPKRAALSILAGLFVSTPKNMWIGPELFNIWGKPSLKRLRTCRENEAVKICQIAEEVYGKCRNLKEVVL